MCQMYLMCRQTRAEYYSTGIAEEGKQEGDGFFPVEIERERERERERHGGVSHEECFVYMLQTQR